MKEIYFSSLLKEKHPNTFKEIKKSFEKHNISIKFIDNTKDIWCRDYMPVKVNENRYIQFKYEPDYLKGYENLKTNPLKLHQQLNINPIISNLNIDGGNIVKYKSKAIMTDKIFFENPEIEKDKLIEVIKNLLMVKALIIFLKQPWDMFGHTDGLIRFIDEDTVLINDLSLESKTYLDKFYKSLEKYNLNFIQITYPQGFLKKYKWGAYLNYVEIDDVIFIPIYGIKEDDYAIDFFKMIFTNKKIEPVLMPQIIKEGGALHCISWMK
jgi:agmatine deiminase